MRRLALILALAATPAMAQSAAEMMAAFDMNGDGDITESDLIARRALAFSRHDRDGDGRLDSAEQAAMAAEANQMRDASGGLRPGGPGEAMHNAAQPGWADGDGDGAVTRAEYDAGSARLFRDFDRNGNGTLTRMDFLFR
jgi:hypothetical protein